MKAATIRQLKHETAALLGCVEAGEQIELTRRGKPVARLSPIPVKRKIRRDFLGRLEPLYGGVALEVTATELIGSARGER